MDSYSAIFAIIRRDATRGLGAATIRFAFIGILFFEFWITASLTFVIAAQTQMPILELATIAAKGYIGVAIVMLTLVGLSAAASAPAQTIGLERKRDTWALLRAAPINPFELVAALLGSSIVVAAIPLAMHVPLFALALAMMEPGDWLKAGAAGGMCAACCVTAGAVGVFFGVLVKRMEAAVSLSVVAIALFAGGFRTGYSNLLNLFGLTLSGGVEGKVAKWTDALLRDLSPGHQAYDLWGGTALPLSVALCLAGMAVVTAICLLGAAAVLRREKPFGTGTRSSTPTDHEIAEAVRKRITVTRRPISDRANPFFVIEMRRSYLGHPLIAAALLIPAVVLYLTFAGLIAWSSPAEPVVAFAWMILAMTFPLVAGMTVMSGMISRECDEDTFDLVAMTTHTPNEIMSGKMRAAAVLVSPAFVLVFVSFVPFWYFGGRHFDLIAMGLVTLAVSLGLELSAGACATVIGRNVRESAILGRVFSLVLLIGFTVLALPAAVTSSWWRTAGLTTSTGDTLIWFTSPLMAFGRYFVLAEEPNRIAYLTITLSIFTALAAAVYFLSVHFLRRRMSLMPLVGRRGLDSRSGVRD